MIWQSLIANLALVSILVVGWDLLSEWTERWSERVRSLLLGLVMGGGAVLSMTTAQELLPGFIVDLRSSLVGAAAYFGGWPAVLVAAAGAVLYRLLLGGAGAVSGAIGILVVAAIGIGLYHLSRSRRRKRDVLAFALAVGLGSLVSLVALPAAVRWEVIARVGFPLASVSFVCTALIGMLLHRLLLRQELANANMIYSAMVRELPDCLNMKDREGRFIAANPATATLMRASSVTNLIGKTDFDFYPADLAARFRQDEVAMLETGTVRRVDQLTVRADGSEGWLSTLKAPFRDESGQITGIITYNRDVTEQKRAAQLKNEFISTVSHELRTPLTSIRGSLGLIAAGVTGELPAKAANLIRIAHTNSERLVHLINDILDMEKIESGKMVFDIKRLPVRPILEQVVAASASYMPEKRVRIVLIDDASRAEANIDPDRVHQVLANLLSNAIKFSSPEETVTVRLGRHGDGQLRISVTDRGTGIPAAFRDRIFGKFEQADASSTRSQGGTGLGLSIARSIVERLGGTIFFESEEGRGTSFHVDLPEATSKASSVSTPLSNTPADGRMRVLICEDEPDISTVIATLLDEQGFSSDVAPDIESAKALLRSRYYAALTLDIRLAGESGIKLFHDIRQSPVNRDVPVIVISAVADEAKRSLNGRAIGIIDWLEKPVDPARLHAALDKIVRRKASARPQILHVEDDEGVLEVMSQGLGADVELAFARTLEEAREMIRQHRYDLVILDIALPDGSGLDLLSELPAETAVVIFSAVDVDQKLGSRVNAIMTKTKASELDVARLVRSFLPTTPTESLPSPGEARP
jgi:PAS domain S-box-containing protein